MKSDDIFSGKLLSTQMAVLSSFSMQRHNDATQWHMFIILVQNVTFLTKQDTKVIKFLITIKCSFKKTDKAQNSTQNYQFIQICLYINTDRNTTLSFYFWKGFRLKIDKKWHELTQNPHNPKWQQDKMGLEKNSQNSRQQKAVSSYALVSSKRAKFHLKHKVNQICEKRRFPELNTTLWIYN